MAAAAERAEEESINKTKATEEEEEEGLLLEAVTSSRPEEDPYPMVSQLRENNHIGVHTNIVSKRLAFEIYVCLVFSFGVFHS